MDKKIAHVAVIAAAVGAYLVIDGEDGGTRAVDMDDVELKVHGNINGDRFLDLDDAGMIQDIIDEGAGATEYPLADADRDGILDGDDVALVEDVAAGPQTLSRRVLRTTRRRPIYWGVLRTIPDIRPYDTHPQVYHPPSIHVMDYHIVRESLNFSC